MIRSSLGFMRDNGCNRKAGFGVKQRVALSVSPDTRCLGTVRWIVDLGQMVSLVQVGIDKLKFASDHSTCLQRAVHACLPAPLGPASGAPAGRRAGLFSSLGMRVLWGV